MLIYLIEMAVHTDSVYQNKTKQKQKQKPHIKGKKLEFKRPKHKFYTILSLLSQIRKSITSTKRKTEKVSLISEITYFVCKHNGLTLWVITCKKNELLNIPEMKAWL